MPREYSPYCIIETTFILGDPRYKGLSPTAKVLYIALWARAFQERREVLPRWYDYRAAGSDGVLGCKTVGRCLKEIKKNLLIELLEDGRIKVLGVKNKGNIHWKEEDKALPQPLPQPLSKKEEREEKEEKRKKGPRVDYSTIPYFEKLWVEYPKGKAGAKSEAYEQWVKFKIEKDTDLQAVMSRAILNQKEWHEKMASQEIFYAEWPHFCRWIKRRRWEDEKPPEVQETQADDEEGWKPPF